MVRISLTKKLEKTWKKSSLGEENSQCKIPPGVIIQEATKAGVAIRGRKREVGDEVTEVRGVVQIM